MKSDGIGVDNDEFGLRGVLRGNGDLLSFTSVGDKIRAINTSPF